MLSILVFLHLLFYSNYLSEGSPTWCPWAPGRTTKVAHRPVLKTAASTILLYSVAVLVIEIWKGQYLKNNISKTCLLGIRFDHQPQKPHVVQKGW